MKRINLYGLLLCIAALLINNGCTEETLPRVSPINTVEQQNSAPISFAGGDIQVILPTNFCWLSGGYSHSGTIDNFVWKKISGPSTYILESPNSLRTKVSNLEKGIYEFELTITNKKGLTGKDTARVIVGEMSLNPKEIIFKDIEWIFPWYSAIEIKDFNLLMPQGIFKVYIQRDNNLQWEEVTPYSENSANKYDYFVETRPDGAGIYTYGSLYIFYYGTDTNDTPSVKIVY
ncbi:PKD domain-containing protein [Flavobacterium yafengii]|uniref:Uncharacterized protein n=2 Tax=Flavobacterium yafengii TaxID=3041253 RepID=A0AAW6TMI2_9FLAO|nr:hypothetical protein [Flavobacterium yafengii]MDI5948818.1 hypothetical protein [Flavobacterium yafengii]